MARLLTKLCATIALALAWPMLTISSQAQISAARGPTFERGAWDEEEPPTCSWPVHAGWQGLPYADNSTQSIDTYFMNAFAPDPYALYMASLVKSPLDGGFTRVRSAEPDARYWSLQMTVDGAALYGASSQNCCSEEGQIDVSFAQNCTAPAIPAETKCVEPSQFSPRTAEHALLYRLYAARGNYSGGVYPPVVEFFSANGTLLHTHRQCAELDNASLMENKQRMVEAVNYQFGSAGRKSTDNAAQLCEPFNSFVLPPMNVTSGLVNNQDNEYLMACLIFFPGQVAIVGAVAPRIPEEVTYWSLATYNASEGTLFPLIAGAAPLVSEAERDNYRNVESVAELPRTGLARVVVSSVEDKPTDLHGLPWLLGDSFGGDRTVPVAIYRQMLPTAVYPYSIRGYTGPDGVDSALALYKYMGNNVPFVKICSKEAFEQMGPDKCEKKAA